MFRRHDNLKRAICLLGVVLAFSSSMQQARAFCFLTGCESASVEQQADQPTCSCHACPASRARQEKSQPSTPDCEDQQDCVATAPSPEPLTCSCFQEPDPLELPKNGSNVLELLSYNTAVINQAAVDTKNFKEITLDTKTAALDALAHTAGQICAQLCRFLT